ncbi:unnamed protein product, partial [Polarella glacialis]
VGTSHTTNMDARIFVCVRNSAWRLAHIDFDLLLLDEAHHYEPICLEMEDNQNVLDESEDEDDRTASAPGPRPQASTALNLRARKRLFFSATLRWSRPDFDFGLRTAVRAGVISDYTILVPFMTAGDPKPSLVQLIQDLPTARRILAFCNTVHPEHPIHWGLPFMSISRVKNEAKPQEVMRVMRACYKSLGLHTFNMADFGLVIQNHIVFLRQCLLVTRRPNEGLLEQAGLLAFPENPSTAKLFASQLCKAVQNCRQKKGKITNGARQIPEVLEIIKLLETESSVSAESSPRTPSRSPPPGESLSRRAPSSSSLDGIMVSPGRILASYGLKATSSHAVTESREILEIYSSQEAHCSQCEPPALPAPKLAAAISRPAATGQVTIYLDSSRRALVRVIDGQMQVAAMFTGPAGFAMGRFPGEIVEYSSEMPNLLLGITQAKKQPKKLKTAVVRAYGKMWYKNTKSYGIRQKFLANKQIFTVRSKDGSMKQNALMAVADAALYRLNTSQLSEQAVKTWVGEQDDPAQSAETLTELVKISDDEFEYEAKMVGRTKEEFKKYAYQYGKGTDRTNTRTERDTLSADTLWTEKDTKALGDFDPNLGIRIKVENKDLDKEAKQFAKLLNAEGVQAGHYNGCTASLQRTRILEDFRKGPSRGGLRVLATVDVLSEGVDLPMADTCLFVEPRKGLRLRQCVGRVLRQHQQKVDALVVSPPIIQEADGRLQADGELVRLLAELAGSDPELSKSLAENSFSRVNLVDQRSNRTEVSSRVAPAIALEEAATLLSTKVYPRALSAYLTADARWQLGLAQLTQYTLEHGHCKVQWKHITGSDFALGIWVSHQRSFRKAYKQENGHTKVPQRYIEDDGFKLGSWVNNVRMARYKISAERIEQLDTLGLVRGVRKAAFWEEGFQLLQAYKQENGHTKVPRSYVADDGFQLGTWVNRQRIARKGQDGRTIDAEQIEQLVSLGFSWGVSKAAFWEEGFQLLQAYKQEHGHTKVPQSYVADDGFKLGTWVNRQRLARKAGGLKIDAEKIVQL